MMDDRAEPDPVPIPIGPELDLHRFHPRDVSSCVEEFVRSAAEAGLGCVRLVHGRGRGILRRTVHETLAQHPSVVECWDDPSSHLGATYARLKPEP